MRCTKAQGRGRRASRRGCVADVVAGEPATPDQKVAAPNRAPLCAGIVCADAGMFAYVDIYV